MRGRGVVAVAVLTAGALAAASATIPVRDSDLFWHLATARETLAHGLVRTDTFSWTARGAPLGTDQWLGQLILYAGYLADGWLGVLAVRTVAVATIVSAIVAAALVRRGRQPVVALAVALPALLLSRFEWTERPELFGAALFAVLVLLLQLEGDLPLILTAPLLVVWANVHGSFALGAGLVLVVGLHGLMDDNERRPAHAVAVVGALASCVLTPAGLGTLTAPGLHFFHPPREIQEWAIPDPTTVAGAIWALELGLVLGTASVTRRARTRDVILIVPVALLSLVAIRHTPLLAIAATPYLADRLPTALRNVAESVVGPLPSRASGARPIPILADAAFALIGIALIAGGIAAAPREIDQSGFPVAALASLPAGPGLFDQYDWGGWLIWSAPRTPVFIDGRLVPYLGPVLDDYHTIIAARPGWRDRIARRGVRWLLVRPSDPVAVRAGDLGWRTLAGGRDFVLVAVPER